ncbi:MAG TPA: YigZ family protein [Thermoanaerobaculia bacterium]|nr:YigZ family protein [Thermoanaerobaculia bacterium]
MSRDSYRTLAEPATFRHKIERSEFLGLAFDVASDDAFFAALKAIEKEHFDATHHCWAFRLFDGRQRSSDAGEPSGTAGKPILSAIEGADLSDAAVVVVRWFGGVKLGTGGLSRAYRETAAQTLAGSKTVERFVYATYRVTVPFDAISAIYRLIDPPHVVLVNEEFGETNTFTIRVRQSRAAELARALTDRRLSFTPR